MYPADRKILRPENKFPAFLMCDNFYG